jgi:diamine N-acetyltransferase
LVNENFFIRRAVPADAPMLSKLSSVTFFDTFSSTCTSDDIQQFISSSFNPQIVFEELQNPDDYYFIAFMDGVAAGYIRMKEDESEVAEIRKHRSIELKRIYVAREFQAQKIGARIMNFALRFAAAKKYNILWLGVWEHNVKAQAFYKKFGFIDSGVTHPFPIGSTPQTDNWLYRFIDKELPAVHICL